MYTEELQETKHRCKCSQCNPSMRFCPPPPLAFFFYKQQEADGSWKVFTSLKQKSGTFVHCEQDNSFLSLRRRQGLNEFIQGCLTRSCHATSMYSNLGSVSLVTGLGNISYGITCAEDFYRLLKIFIVSSLRNRAK